MNERGEQGIFLTKNWLIMTMGSLIAIGLMVGWNLYLGAATANEARITAIQLAQQQDRERIVALETNYRNISGDLNDIKNTLRQAPWAQPK